MPPWLKRSPWCGVKSGVNSNIRQSRRLTSLDSQINLPGCDLGIRMMVCGRPTSGVARIDHLE